MVVMQKVISYHDEFERRRLDHAATIIQTYIRRFLAIRLVDRLRYEREALRQLQEKHAIILQSHIRRFLAERYVQKIRAERSASPMEQEERRISEEKAAIKIQSQIRKFLAIRRVERIRAHQEALRQIKERHAAVVIQRTYRSYKQKQDQKFERAAVVLQANIRKFLCVRRYKRIKTSLKSTDRQIPFEEKMEIDHAEALERLQDPNNKENEISDQILDAACDRLISESTKAAQAADHAGPLRLIKKPSIRSAAVIIQRSWRGYNTRRRHSDVLEKLAKTRLSLKNAPNITENPRDHRSMPIRQRIDIYMPLFYKKNLKHRQLAASFMNRITKESNEFAKEFIDRDGISAIIAASSNLGRDYADTLLQKELSELLLKCLNCPASQKDVDQQIEELLKILVSNVNKHRKDKTIMNASSTAIYQLCKHSQSPGILKNLQFPFSVSQLRKQLGPNSKNELLGSLQKCEEVLKLINAMPE